MKTFDSIEDCYTYFSRQYNSSTLCFELLERHQKGKQITEKFKVFSGTKEIETVTIYFSEDD